MNKIGKILLIFAIICIAICITLLIIDMKENDNLNTEKITLEKFNDIKIGMTYQDVVNLIGEEGIILSDSNIGNNEEYHTTIYYWYAENGIANVNVTIQGGKVISKLQIGLK